MLSCCPRFSRAISFFSVVLLPRELRLREFCCRRFFSSERGRCCLARSCPTIGGKQQQAGVIAGGGTRHPPPPSHPPSHPPPPSPSSSSSSSSSLSFVYSSISPLVCSLASYFIEMPLGMIRTMYVIRNFGFNKKCILISKIGLI